MKKVSIRVSIVVLLMLAGSTALCGQAKKAETTVEQEYLNSVEDVLINELARAEDRDTKFVSLQYAEDALKSGKGNEMIRDVLIFLASEGVFQQTQAAGRLVNSYPDVRMRACDLLGQIKTEESKAFLLRIAVSDADPAVVTTAIRSLGDIGLNTNNEVGREIAWIQTRNAATNLSNSLALEVLNAYEKILKNTENKDDKAAIYQSISAIAANTRYITPVRTKALVLLKSR